MVSVLIKYTIATVTEIARTVQMNQMTVTKHVCPANSNAKMAIASWRSTNVMVKITAWMAVTKGRSVRRRMSIAKARAGSTAITESASTKLFCVTPKIIVEISQMRPSVVSKLCFNKFVHLNCGEKSPKQFFNRK